MSTRASYDKFRMTVDSLSSVFHPQATYWYHDIIQGELIIYDQDDYQKFCTKLEQGSVKLSLEGWVHIEKVVCLKFKSLLSTMIDMDQDQL